MWNEKADDITRHAGESTTAGRILSRDHFGDKLKEFIRGDLSDKRPFVWGTCSGLIMLANDLENQKQGGQYHIGGLDVTVSRNFFGRQINSFEADVTLSEDGLTKGTDDGSTSFHGVFIRAPAVVSCNKEQVKVLGTIMKEEKSTEPIIVAVQQDNIVATSFHPELTEDLRWHTHFLKMVLSQ
ncbi:probable pyridoxal 5'-phosphate synthase subunit pdx2 [Clytia hemisphaerica]